MKDIKIIEVKSEIGAGTRGASLGVEAMKIASLDLNSDFFKQYDFKVKNYIVVYCIKRSNLFNERIGGLLYPQNYYSI